MATYVVTWLPPRFDLDYAEESITRDAKSFSTIASYVAIATIYINLSQLKFPIVGIVASAIYSLVNGAFLGRAFFREEKSFLRLLLGLLLLVILLGLVGWVTLAVYNLDEVRILLVLLIVATGSSILNRRRK